MEMDFKELHLSVFNSVYPPAEDSFMLTEAAEMLQGRVLEVGCGCGIASLSCKNASEVIGVDINPEAVNMMEENILLNKVVEQVIPILGDASEIIKLK